MKHIGQFARQSLARHNLGTTGAVGVALRVIGEALQIELRQGYLQHGRLFVVMDSHAASMRLFQQRITLIDSVNAALQEHGFSHRVCDIRRAV